MNELGSPQGDQLSTMGQTMPQQSQGTSQTASKESDVSIRDFFNVLRRRKAIALQTFVVVVAVGVVITLMTRPRYSSNVKLLVEGKAAALALNNTTDPLTDLFLPNPGHDVNTQVEILRAPILISKVCTSLGIAQRDISMDVRQVSATDVIDLTATSTSPDLAQKFAAAVPRVYLADLKVSRLREVTSALDFAMKRRKERQARLIRSERSLEEFKNKAGVIDAGAQGQLDITSLGQAEAAVRQAEADVATTSARLGALQSSQRDLPRFVESPTTTSNPQVGVLKQQIDDLEVEKKKLLFLYKENEDPVQSVILQIKALEQRLANTPAEVTTTSKSLNPLIGPYQQSLAEARAAADAARANLNKTQARASSLKAGLAKYNPVNRTLAQLQRDIQDDSDAVLALDKSVEELSIRKSAAESKDDPISVLQDAGRAGQIAPNMPRNILLALVLGVLLASGAALLQDSLDDHLNDEEETRWLLNIPILGHLPFLPAGESRLVSLRQSDAQLLERFRVLRSNVQFTLVNRPGRLLQVTSTVPEEGKSSTAANLAISIALDARRVILLDADLHRPKTDKLFGLAQQPGLTNVLVGQATIQEALQQTDIPGMQVLTAGVLPPNSAELLNSNSMDELLEQLKDLADVVIIDTPPCLATADAQVISSKVDGVIYVMELGKVRKSAVHRSFELLYQAHANVLGVVFNKMQTNSGGSYYNYEYYGYSEDKNIGNDAIEDVKRSLLSQINSLDSPNGKTSKDSDRENGARKNSDADEITSA